MDPAKNPFSPGHSLAPPFLAGRRDALDRARLLWTRLRQGRGNRSLLFTGLRGSGKSVLLAGLSGLARQDGCVSAKLEAQAGKPLAGSLIPALRGMLFELGKGSPTPQVLAVLGGFIRVHGPAGVPWTDGTGPDLAPADPLPGKADSGDIGADLADLLRAIGRESRDRHAVLTLFLDEVQALTTPELEALVMAQQRLQEEQAPLALILAGLPFQQGLGEAGEIRAAQVFDTLPLPPLAEADLVEALQAPAKREGAGFAGEALREILRLSRGLPYFVQAWAHHAWNQAEGPAVTAADLRRCAAAVTRGLDRDFYGPGFERLSPREKNYLRSMAHHGGGPHRSGDIADSMDAKISSLGPLRAKLIRRGLIYSPAHGLMDFTAQGYDEFMRRTMPYFR